MLHIPMARHKEGSDERFNSLDSLGKSALSARPFSGGESAFKDCKAYPGHTFPLESQGKPYLSGLADS